MTYNQIKATILIVDNKKNKKIGIIVLICRIIKLTKERIYMKENKLVNIVLVMIVVFMILFMVKGTVLADDNNNTNFINLTGTITGGNNTVNNTITRPANNTVNNTITRPANNTILTTNNTLGNNSSLPKTGIESSISGVVLIVVLGISAVYAYNKIQDYKNI